MIRTKLANLRCGRALLGINKKEIDRDDVTFQLRKLTTVSALYAVVGNAR
jgi:hypothetical protein